MVVKEVQRFARVVRFQPKCYFAQLHSQFVFVYSVNTIADNIAHSSAQVATSSIEAMFAGCAIRETWKPLKGGGGGSFSHYDAERRHWRQAWIDSSGTRVDFDGGGATRRRTGKVGRGARRVAGTGQDQARGAR